MDTVQMRLPESTDELNTALSQQLLVTAKQAARMCGRSLRTWRAWDSAGWIPQPIRIGRATLWRADELRTWVEAGCPRRAEWEARQ
jgi:predicted DNA-binding transcriptional regulator AlpA